MRVFLWIFLANQFAKPSELKQVSEFGLIDKNDLCVFGNVKSITEIEEQIAVCYDGCQVSIGLKNISLGTSSRNHPSLFVSIYPKGQTLHTLTHTYMNLTYPDKYVATFLVSFWNVNGYHEDLLESFQIEIPLDRSRLGSDSNQRFNLEVGSECACNAVKDNETFGFNDIPKLDETISVNTCFLGGRESSWFTFYCFVTLVVIGLVVIGLVVLMFMIYGLVRAFELKKRTGDLKRKSSMENIEETQQVDTVQQDNTRCKVEKEFDA